MSLVKAELLKSCQNITALINSGLMQVDSRDYLGLAICLRLDLINVKKSCRPAGQLTQALHSNVFLQNSHEAEAATSPRLPPY